MSTPWSEAGSDATLPSPKPKGYGEEIFSLLHYIADTVPMKEGTNLQELRVVFREAADYLMGRMGGVHEDFPKAVQSLAEVAKQKPLLRREAVGAISTFYNELPADADKFADRAARETLMEFLKDTDPSVRLAATEGLEKAAVWTVLDPSSSYRGSSGRKTDKEKFAEALSAALEAEQDPQVSTAVRDVIDLMQKTELTRLRQLSPVLKR